MIEFRYESGDDMSKYYLVGRYYDKVKGKYIDKFFINSVNGEKLSSLKKIDEFTSRYEQIELFNMIKKENNRDDFNFLSVMYLKNNGARPYYYSTIMGDKIYNDCINSASYDVKNIDGFSRNTLFINVNSKLYKDEVSRLLDIIGSKDYKKFEESYPYKNNLSSLVWRYMTASYDNEFDKEKDLKLILLEFSRYKTFRGWYVSSKKKSYKSSYVGNKSGVGNKSVSKVKKGKVLSIEEYEREYEIEFGKNNDVSYDSYNLDRYNQDNDEFLDEEEYGMMNDYSDDNFSNYDNKSLGRRH